MGCTNGVGKRGRASRRTPIREARTAGLRPPAPPKRGRMTRQSAEFSTPSVRERNAQITGRPRRSSLARGTKKVSRDGLPNFKPDKNRLATRPEIYDKEESKNR